MAPGSSPWTTGWSGEAKDVEDTRDLKDFHAVLEVPFLYICYGQAKAVVSSRVWKTRPVGLV